MFQNCKFNSGGYRQDWLDFSCLKHSMGSSRIWYDQLFYWNRCWVDDDDELFLWYAWPMKDLALALFSLISSRDHCQGSSLLQISNTLQAGFEPAHNLSSGFVE